MYIRIYINIYIIMYVYIHTYIYIYIYLYIYIYYIIEFIPFVCLSVCIKILSTDTNQDMLYIVGRRILWSRFICYFQDFWEHCPDAIVRKLDSCEKVVEILFVFMLL